MDILCSLFLVLSISVCRELNCIRIISLYCSALFFSSYSRKYTSKKSRYVRHMAKPRNSGTALLPEYNRLEYLNEVSQTYDDTVIKTYCKNEMVNSVLSIYNSRFEERRIHWEVQVSIGEKLPCSEMMFCAILSNVLENAMHAVQELPQEKRLIQLALSEKSGHLLLMAKNTVQNAPVFIDGVPVTERSGHGLGARSIVYYVEKLNGQYQFFMENGDFVVMIIIPATNTMVSQLIPLEASADCPAVYQK
jgi:hypothetical protein